jgi:hypothetical protein
MNEYTVYTFTLNGQQVVAAVHWRDARQFRLDYPDAVARK